MAVMTIMWVTKEDLRVCPVCKPLHNNIWAFDTEHDAFPQQIYSPVAKKHVWDATRDISIAHVGFTNAGCRCKLKVDFEIQNIATRLHRLRARALEMHGVTESWSTGQRLVLRHEGRFISWRKA